MAERAATSRSRNAALEAQMKKLRVSAAALARAIDVPDPKTVERWLDGINEPQRRNAEATARVLGCHIWDLWPQKYPSPDLVSLGMAARHVYPSRRSVPASFWKQHFGQATEALDIWVYGGTFLFDQVDDFQRLLHQASDRGVTIRFMVGDAESDAVRLRGGEEGIGIELTFRCRMTLKRIQMLPDDIDLEVRTSASALYASLFHVDDTIVANHHILNSPASDNPVLVVDRSTSPSLWTTYAASFERAWQAATPASGQEKEL